MRLHVQNYVKAVALAFALSASAPSWAATVSRPTLIDGSFNPVVPDWALSTGLLARQSDGKLVLAGVKGNYPSLIRLNNDGSPDPEFKADLNLSLVWSNFSSVTLQAVA